MTDDDYTIDADVHELRRIRDELEADHGSSYARWLEAILAARATGYATAPANVRNALVATSLMATAVRMQQYGQHAMVYPLIRSALTFAAAWDAEVTARIMPIPDDVAAL